MLIAVGLPAALAACERQADEPTAVRELDVTEAGDEELRERVDRARLLVDAGEDRAAAELLRGVLRERPGDPEVLRLLADLELSRGRFEEALSALQPLIEREEVASTDFADAVRALEELGRYDAAVAVARDWSERHRRDADAHFQLGRLAYLVDDLKTAAESLRRAERLQAGRADVRSELGLVLLRRGNRDEAEAKQRDAVERDPKFALAWFRLGDAISRAGPERRTQAIRAMERSLELDPRGRDAMTSRVFLYRQYQLALTEGDDSVQESADRLWQAVLRRLSPRELRFGRTGPRALQSDLAPLREAVRAAEPTEPAPRVALARRLHAAGEFEVAAELYQAALSAYGADAPGDVALDAGCALAATGDTDEALVWLQRATGRAAEDVHAWRALGWVLLLADRPDEGLRALERALELAEDPRVVARLRRARGLAWLRLGRLDEGLNEVAAAGWF